MRGERSRLTDLALADDERELAGASDDCLEIGAEFELGDAREFGLVVRRSPGGEEETRIVYEPAAGRLTVDRGRSSDDPRVERAPAVAKMGLADSEPLRLRVFLDRSAVEVFANERSVLTTRIYPTRPDSVGLRVLARGGRARARTLDVWRMRGIWPEGGE